MEISGPVGRRRVDFGLRGCDGADHVVAEKAVVLVRQDRGGGGRLSGRRHLHVPEAGRLRVGLRLLRVLQRPAVGSVPAPSQLEDVAHLDPLVQAGGGLQGRRHLLHLAQDVEGGATPGEAGP